MIDNRLVISFVSYFLCDCGVFPHRHSVFLLCSPLGSHRHVHLLIWLLLLRARSLRPSIIILGVGVVGVNNPTGTAFDGTDGKSGPELGLLVADNVRLVCAHVRRHVDPD